MKSGYITAEGQLTEKALNALEVNKKLKEEWVINLKRMGERPRIIHLNLDQAKKIKEIIERHFNENIRQLVNYLNLTEGRSYSPDLSSLQCGVDVLIIPVIINSRVVFKVQVSKNRFQKEDYNQVFRDIFVEQCALNNRIGGLCTTGFIHHPVLRINGGIFNQDQHNETAIAFVDASLNSTREMSPRENLDVLLSGVKTADDEVYDTSLEKPINLEERCMKFLVNALPRQKKHLMTVRYDMLKFVEEYAEIAQIESLRLLRESGYFAFARHNELMERFIGKESFNMSSLLEENMNPEIAHRLLLEQAFMDNVSGFYFIFPLPGVKDALKFEIEDTEDINRLKRKVSKITSAQWMVKWALWADSHLFFSFPFRALRALKVETEGAENINRLERKVSKKELKVETEGAENINRLERKISKITSAQLLFNRLALLGKLDLCRYMKDEMSGFNGLKINFEALKNAVASGNVELIEWMSDHEQMAMMSGSNQKNSLFKDKKARQSEGGARGATSECDKEGLSLQRLKSKMSRKEFREIQQCAWLSGSQEMVELIFPEKVKGSDEKGRSGTVFSLKNLSELEGAIFFFDIINLSYLLMPYSVFFFYLSYSLVTVSEFSSVALMYRSWLDIDGKLLEISCDAGQHQTVMDMLDDGMSHPDYRELIGIACNREDPKMLNILLASLGEKLETVDAGNVFTCYMDNKIKDFYSKLTGEGCDKNTAKGLKKAYLTAMYMFGYGLTLMLGAMRERWAVHSSVGHSAATLVFLRFHARACLTRIKENKGIGGIEGVYLQVFSLLIRVYLLISFYRGAHKVVDLDMGSSDLASSGDQYGQCSQFGLFADNGVSLDDGVCLEDEDAHQMTCCM